MILSRSYSGLLALGASIALATSSSAQSTPAQTSALAVSAPKPIGFVVPEWKSQTSQIIVRARGRAQHDFYRVTRDFEAGSINGETKDDDLRALRLGVDGQFSPKIKFRADANLTASQVNWVDMYVGYSGAKYDLFVGQNYLAATIENASPDINFPLPENSLVNIAFGQNVRSFGVVGRVKSADWQVVGGLYQGNINAGDIFGDDVLRYAQVRGTYSPRHKDRDVLHIGASLRLRDAQGGALLRYATRPAATNFGPRTLDSGNVGKSDTTLALEAMVVQGSFMVIAEHEVLWADTPLGAVAMNGSYVEGCWWLTGESRRYAVSTGTVGQVKPKKSIRAGGLGAIALVARLEQLDQTDARLGSRAGRVQGASLGISWTPVEFVLFRLAASQSTFSGPVPARNGEAQVVMGRAQFSF
jgi:phosphate-selective porin OprO and OprP